MGNLSRNDFFYGQFFLFIGFDLKLYLFLSINNQQIIKEKVMN
jgi:hypothetical protein